MEKIRLGRTGLMVSRTSFGCIPLIRIEEADAIRLLHRAHDAGINFFDTGYGYGPSEERLGKAFSHMRGKVLLATKNMATTPEDLRSYLEESLRRLGTDHVDLFQFHNLAFVPAPGDALYDMALALQREGKIRFIGYTNHDLQRAKQAVSSGAFDALQFPLSALSAEEELSLSALCREADMGLIAMKALAGGLLTNAASAFAFLWQYGNIVPIWGIQHEWELDEFIALSQMPPTMTEEIRTQIEKDRKELSGSFCRSCGYCLPCPADIDIPQSARMSLLLRRFDPTPYVTPEWQAKMRRVRNCTHCNACAGRCPYHLDTPELLASELAKYEDYLVTHDLA